MSESPTRPGGERAPPADTQQTQFDIDIDTDVDFDAERPVDDAVELEEFDTTISPSLDAPIEAPIEDVIEQHIAVPFDDEVHADAR